MKNAGVALFPSSKMVSAFSRANIHSERTEKSAMVIPMAVIKITASRMRRPKLPVVFCSFGSGG